MQKLVREYLDELNRRQKRGRKIAVAVALLVMIAVGAVAGILTQYGVAMTDAPKCGLEEHKHDESCYARKLACGLEEGEGHTHTAECSPAAELTCGKAEGEGHTHTAECSPAPELACGLEESEGHAHTESCLAEDGSYICGLEGSEGHTHTEDCYVVKEGYTCGLEEGEGHTHTENCYTMADGYICGLEEGEGHTHTDSCYTEELICRKEEHEHTDGCYTDDSADIEDPASWDSQYAQTQWKEAWGEDLVTAARMQLGYRESVDNYIVAESGAHKGYTRYGHFAGSNYVDWDAAFVGFCMHYAGMQESGLFPVETDTAKWQEEFIKINGENQNYLTEAAGYMPQAGDLVFLGKENEETPVQMGIVSAFDSEANAVFAIEGNSADEVRENQYDAGDTRITGYLKISELETAYRNAENGPKESRTMTAEGEGYTVTVSFTEDAEIPEDAVLEVREIEKGSGEYQKYYDETRSMADAEELDFARYFDITFLADGEEIEPKAPVHVEIVCTDGLAASGGSGSNVIHFAEGGTELLDSRLNRENNSIQFTQDSFSVSGVYRAALRASDGGKYSFSGLNDLNGKKFFLVNYHTTSGINLILTSNPVQNNNASLQGILANQGFSSATVWRFEQVSRDGNEFYISDGSNYLYVGSDGLRMQETPVKLRVQMDASRPSQIMISAISGNYNINSNNRGVEENFIVYGGNSEGKADPGNWLTLHKAEGTYDVVLNPYNIHADGAVAEYRFNIDGIENGFNKRIRTVFTGSEAVITLPAENNRRQGFRVIEGTEKHTIGDVANKYQWKLNGWYNIGTGTYHQPGETVRISSGQNNVFYADWIPANYNNGNVENGLGETVETVGKTSFIRTKLFDYNELANISLKNAGSGTTLVQNGTESEEWKPGGANFNFIEMYGSMGSLSMTSSLRDKLTQNTHGSYPIYDGMFSKTGKGSDWICEQIPLFQVIFNETGQKMGVQYLGETANELYQLDADGTYHYDSAQNAASFDPVSKLFRVYKGLQRINQTADENAPGSPSFLPFNDKVNRFMNTSGTRNDGTVNYWFGMKTEIDFWLDEDSDESGTRNLNHGKQMKFDFSGDDDLWVFMDDELVLNLSGVHGAWNGSVNFSTGKVLEQGSNEISKKFHSGKHTLKIYYLERGSGLSNCKISFNLTPSWNISGEPVKEVAVNKKWAKKDGTGGAVSIEENEKPSVLVELCEVNNGAIAPVKADGLDAGQQNPVELNTGNGWACTWKYLDKDKEYTVREVGSNPSYQVEYQEKKSTLGSWIENSSLKKNDKVRIASGNITQPDNYARKLLGNQLTACDAWATKNGDVLREEGLSKEDTDWIVAEVQTDTQGHMQFKLKNSRNQYLTIADGNVSLKGNPGPAEGWFSFGGTGILVNATGKALVYQDGRFQSVGRAGADENNLVHIYKFIDDDQNQLKSEWEVTNTLITANLELQKVNRKGDALSGAEFDLYKEEDFDNAANSPKPGKNPYQSLAFGNATTYLLKDLPAGSYYLVETKAPEQYALLEKAVKISVNKDGIIAERVEVDFQRDDWKQDNKTVFYDSGSKTIKIQVPNVMLYTLPSTGGAGIYWYSVSGILFMMAGALILYKNKCKEVLGG